MKTNIQFFVPRSILLIIKNVSEKFIETLEIYFV